MYIESLEITYFEVVITSNLGTDFLACQMPTNNTEQDIII